MEMSESNRVREASKGTATPAAEFRRWLLVACALAVFASCGLLAMNKLIVRDNPGRLLFYGFWTVFAACESWIQFDSVGRRWLWTVSGVLMGASFFYISVFESGARHVSWRNLDLVFLLPAWIEFRAAFGVRKRPWIWIIATPILYGSIYIWVDRVSSAADSVMRSVSGVALFPMTIPSEIPESAAIFAVILISRAVVGSFIASRKQCDDGSRQSR
jgi:hypothetical protein